MPRPSRLRATPSLLGACLALAAACESPPPSPPPPEEPPTPFVDEGYDLSDVELGRVDGRPVPDGSPLLLDDIVVSCHPGPDPSLDNEDPAAEAEERWIVELTTFGWASVTRGVRVFLWDGTPDDGTDVHRLLFSAPVSMDQDPSGQSPEPYDYDRWDLAIPVVAEASAALTIDGTTLPCTDQGPSPSPSTT